MNGSGVVGAEPGGQSDQHLVGRQLRQAVADDAQDDGHATVQGLQVRLPQHRIERVAAQRLPHQLTEPLRSLMEAQQRGQRRAAQQAAL